MAIQQPISTKTYILRMALFLLMYFVVHGAIMVFVFNEPLDDKHIAKYTLDTALFVIAWKAIIAFNRWRDKKLVAKDINK